tara:strand:+ start:388 stop:618 length:231 start_codon:yes stop_codon:yes gene_type:complete
MSAEQIVEFAKSIKADAELRALCESTKCSDVDDQCDVAKQKGFDVHPHDFDNFLDGELVESSDEDSFMIPNWWERV